jgi:hypothetical protein
MPLIPIFLLILLICLVVALVGTGVFLYASVKGVTKVAGSLSRSALPRSIVRSLKESRQYGRLIKQTVQQYPEGPMRDRLELTTRPVDDWLANLTKLEKGLEKLYGQRNLTRELRQARFEIDELRRQMLLADKNEAAYLRQLMDSKKQHLATLKELQAFQTQAELKIRKIASDLGATHAEILLVIARGDFNENRFRRLDENLQDHLSGIRDMLSAMDEMGYSGVVGY